MGAERGRAPAIVVAILLAGVAAAGLATIGCGGSAGGGSSGRANTARAFPGYTLFAPNFETTTYLIDLSGRVVHRWESEYEPGQSAYLLENGHLLRTAGVGPANRTFRGGGAGGRVQEFTWDGELVWDFEFSTDDHLLHHDIEPLPNGNVLMIAWERKTPEECVAAGRHPALTKHGDLWSDFVIEVEKTGPRSGRIVWEWRAFDHLVQDEDPDAPNHGSLSEHPERIDANHQRWAEQASDEDWESLKGLGYLSGGSSRARNPDWLHINSIDYHPGRDEIVLSVHGFNELWVIDHSTSTAEAAGSSGGRSGRGGDLLYRWGNPRAYGQGGLGDRRLFLQHDVSWIPETGHLLYFNNGRGRPDGDFSSVEEIAPPLDAEGRYILEPGRAFGPAKPAWTWSSPGEFYSEHISGAERLPNGNTLVCSGAQGWIFEVTPGGEIAWSHHYVNESPRKRPRPPRGRQGPGGSESSPNCVFRAYRYGTDYPAFAGRDLRTED